MDKIELGKTGERVSVLGLGTWKLDSDVEREVAALREGFGLGMSLVDTAEMYGTEGIVGKALEGAEDIFVATKVTPDHFNYDDLIKACNQSLKNLKIKQIDLYQLHWPNPRIPIGETMRAMEDLVDQGRIRHIGVSNFSIKEIEEAQSSMKKNEIVSNQVEYSVLVRTENETIDYCKRNKITIMAYSPLARGLLFKRNARLLELLSGIGRNYSKTAAQVALAWVLSRGVIAIPKASDKKHVKENAAAAGFKLKPADLDKINRFL